MTNALGDRSSTEILTAQQLGTASNHVKTAYIDNLININSTLNETFEIETGKTINPGEVVMLNVSGKIYPIEFTGTEPLLLPIGAEHLWGNNTNPRSPTHIVFVGEKEFIIQFEGSSDELFVLGGKVDSAGAFTFTGAPTLVFTGLTQLRTNEIVIDYTTNGTAEVSGISSGYFAGTGGGTRGKAQSFKAKEQCI